MIHPFDFIKNVFGVLKGVIFMNRTDDGFVSIRSDLDYEDFTDIMLERIDEYGLVYIPGQKSIDRDDTGKTCRLLMDSEALRKTDIRALVRSVIKGVEREAASKNASNTSRQEQTEFYKKYILPFDSTGFDTAQLENITAKFGIIFKTRRLTEAVASGKMLSQSAADYLKQNIDVTLSPEEYGYFQEYISSLRTESAKRLGARGEFALQLILKTQQYFTLLCEGCTDKKLLRETRRCIAANTAAAAAAINMRTVDNTLIDRYEKITRWTEEGDDDSLDEFFRPQKTNTAKSMAPLLIYFIIRDYSDCDYHLRQQDIIDLLELRYGFTLERKALGRIIHALEDMELDIYSDRASGVWMEFCA